MTDRIQQSNDLPDGWTECVLPDFCELIMGQSPPSSTYTTDKIGLPFYQGKTEFGPIFPTPVKYCTTPLRIAQEGDVLMSVRAPVGPTNIAPHRACIGRGLAAIRPRDRIPTKYVFYLLRSREGHIAQQGTGTTFQAISKDFLENLVLPLPPLPEQHRIVAKIEELFSDLDASVAALLQAQAHLRIYRQAVLKYAFDGRLTERWRAQHAPPPASELLAQIQAERAQRHQRQLAEWKATVQRWEAAGRTGRKPARPRQPDELAPLSAAELEDLGELPEGWAWARVADVGEVRLGRQRSPERASGPNMCQYMRAANVTWNGLDLTDIKSMDFTPEEQDTYRLHKGDILLSEASGSVSEVGKPAIWREQIENCCFQNTLIRVRPEKVLSEYLHLHFYFDAKMERFSNIARGVGIHHLGANGMTYWTIALPSVTEQQAIVAEVEARLSVVDKLEETLAAALRQAEALRQSILRRAFAGKLIPQDPSDEPAQRLLERIRKARQDQLL